MSKLLATGATQRTSCPRRMRLRSNWRRPTEQDTKAIELRQAGCEAGPRREDTDDHASALIPAEGLQDSACGAIVPLRPSRGRPTAQRSAVTHQIAMRQRRNDTNGIEGVADELIRLTTKDLLLEET